MQQQQSHYSGALNALEMYKKKVGTKSATFVTLITLGLIAYNILASIIDNQFGLSFLKILNILMVPAFLFGLVYFLIPVYYVFLAENYKKNKYSKKLLLEATKPREWARVPAIIALLDLENMKVLKPLGDYITTCTKYNHNLGIISDSLIKIYEIRNNRTVKKYLEVIDTMKKQSTTKAKKQRKGIEVLGKDFDDRKVLLSKQSLTEKQKEDRMLNQRIHYVDRIPIAAFCMISREPIDKIKSKIVMCPYCKTMASAILLGKYLRDNDRCPICQKEIRIQICPEVRVRTEDEEE